MDAFSGPRPATDKERNAHLPGQDFTKPIPRIVAHHSPEAEKHHASLNTAGPSHLRQAVILYRAVGFSELMSVTSAALIKFDFGHETSASVAKKWDEEDLLESCDPERFETDTFALPAKARKDWPKSQNQRNKRPNIPPLS